MHNTGPKKGFSFFFSPPLLGMLKNHQKETDIQNFDENSFFFPPPKKSSNFTHLKFSLEEHIPHRFVEWRHF
jgi:hypothetical protein